tara:strand:- start:146 stop:352 length:207 start_codon:yes stop_codon:yes gene_type:complete
MMERTMSGTKRWIMEIEDTFWDSVQNIIKNSKTSGEAVSRSISLGKSMVPYIDSETIEDTVQEVWSLA